MIIAVSGIFVPPYARQTLYQLGDLPIQKERLS